MGPEMDKKPWSLLLAVITLAVLTTPADAARWDIRGKVMRVLDGDTVEVVPGGDPAKTLRVRLYGINCPEKYEPFGGKARSFTEEAVLYKNVALITKGKDKYGRTLAFLIFGRPGGYMSLNYELVKAGLAVMYTNDFAFDAERTFHDYRDAQVSAMMDQRGVWSRDDTVKYERKLRE